MTEKDKFHMWAENGKYYYETAEHPKKEITKEEFERILANETVTSIGFTQDQSLGLSELMDQFLSHRKEKTSEFGRRVNVIITEESQVLSDVTNGVDVHYKLRLLDEESQEESEDLYTITSSIEGITGPLTDSGVYYPELFRAMYQLTFNGQFANKDEWNIMKQALEGKHNSQDSPVSS